MKILNILTAAKDEIQKAKAARKAKALARKQEALIDGLEDKRDDLQTKIESLESVTMDTVNVDTWCKQYHEAKRDLLLIEKEIEIAKSVQEEMFGK